MTVFMMDTAELRDLGNREKANKMTVGRYSNAIDLFLESIDHEKHYDPRELYQTARMLWDGFQVFTYVKIDETRYGVDDADYMLDKTIWAEAEMRALIEFAFERVTPEAREDRSFLVDAITELDKLERLEDHYAARISKIEETMKKRV